MTLSCFIDTHCHLDDVAFETNRFEIIRECLNLNIQNIINPSIHVNNFDQTLSICDEINHIFYKKIMYPALGLHPVYLSQHHKDHIDILDDYLKYHKNQVIAVGEIGLDLFLADLDIQQQYFYFIEQLKLAKKYSFPVIIHSRKAHDLIYKALRQIEIKGGIIHAFNGSMQQAQKLIDLNFKLGFGGTLTYSRSLNIRRLATELPLSSIVLETDSPDIPLADMDKNQPNNPTYIIKIAEQLALLRQISIEEIKIKTYKNFYDIFF